MEVAAIGAKASNARYSNGDDFSANFGSSIGRAHTLGRRG